MNRHRRRPESRRAAQARLIIWLSMMLFALLGAAARYLISGIQTRTHIVIFWAIAAAFQALVQRLLGYRLGRYSFVLIAGAATIAILATKIALEGVPRVPG
jgi:hypothetical protein